MTMAAEIIPPVCIHCDTPMVLRTTTKFTYHNTGRPRKFWSCPRWPSCKGCTIGAHPDGTPLGFPGDEETNAARQRAHASFDRLWKPDFGGRMSRVGAYRLAQRLMGMSEADCHIGKFNAAQCELLIKKLARLRPGFAVEVGAA